MTPDEFEAALQRDGYQVFFTGFRAGEVIPEHGHAWDARIMVLGGEITITRDGKAETFRRGDTCAIPPNYPHAEVIGPRGVALMSGRKPA